MQISPDDKAVIKIVGKWKGTHDYFPTCRKGDFLIFCPKCNEVHFVTNSWLSGSTQSPSASPSIVILRPEDETLSQAYQREPSNRYKCHFLLQDGRIRYTGDCHNGCQEILQLPSLDKWNHLLKHTDEPLPE